MLKPPRGKSETPIAILTCFGLLSLLLSVAFTQEPAHSSGKTVQATEGIRVSQPVAHKNLAVYFLHSDTRDDQEFLTLNEGLKLSLIHI